MNRPTVRWSGVLNEKESSYLEQQTHISVLFYTQLQPTTLEKDPGHTGDKTVKETSHTEVAKAVLFLSEDGTRSQRETGAQLLSHDQWDQHNRLLLSLYFVRVIKEYVLFLRYAY